MKKICVVEDEESLSEIIKMNLEIEGYSVETISHGTEAFLRSPEMDEFDLVILDVMLPEVSGLTICREIRKYSKVPVLFLSAKGTTQDRIAGLRLGANDYLPKPFDLEELLLRVQVLIDGFEELNNEPLQVINIGEFEINFATFQVENKASGKITDLSKRETDLLKLFYDKKGLVVSREEILDTLWRNDQFPTARTIDNYILTFRKLFENDPKDPQYFHSIRGVGYKFTIDH
ncbi:MAG: response regulator transcription factor [Crocinitomicaceae bacterium]|nr:response regulator transcription factor [Crocinitomicaceae bacterium]